MQFAKISLLGLFALLFATQVCQGQTSQPDPLNFDKFINQVYIGSGRDYIKPDSRRYNYMKVLYANRIFYVKNDQEKLDLDRSTPLLSSVPLYNVYQKGLSRDTSFNPETFNPFKYNFDFYSPHKLTYRIDGTAYLIVIHPQEIKRN